MIDLNPPVGEWTDEMNAAFEEEHRNYIRRRGPAHNYPLDCRSYKLGYVAACHTRHAETMAWKQAHEDLLAVRQQDLTALSARIEELRSHIRALCPATAPQPAEPPAAVEPECVWRHGFGSGPCLVRGCDNMLAPLRDNKCPGCGKTIRLSTEQEQTP